MTDSALSRRVSEFAGVALFGAALLWLIALVTYSASDPVWFFNDLPGTVVHNFAGRFGAFLSTASFQMCGYAAFLIPLIVGVIGWHYFWCTTIDAGYTKAAGAVLFVASLAGLFEIGFGVFDATIHAGGWLGSAAAVVLSVYFGRTGATIGLLTTTALSVILTTQFSFGRAAAAIGQRLRVERGLMDRWTRLARRPPAREGASADRREAREEGGQGSRAGNRQPGRGGGGHAAGRALAGEAGCRGGARTRPLTGDADAGHQATRGHAGRPAAAAAAAALRRRDEVSRGAAPGRLRDAAGHAARRAEGGPQDRRARTAGCRPPARGEVPRVLGRGHGRPDPSRARWSRPSSSSPTPA